MTQSVLPTGETWCSIRYSALRSPTVRIASRSHTARRRCKDRVRRRRWWYRYHVLCTSWLQKYSHCPDRTVRPRSSRQRATALTWGPFWAARSGRGGERGDFWPSRVGRVCGSYGWSWTPGPPVRSALLMTTRWHRRTQGCGAPSSGTWRTGCSTTWAAAVGTPALRTGMALAIRTTLSWKIRRTLSSPVLTTCRMCWTPTTRTGPICASRGSGYGFGASWRHFSSGCERARPGKRARWRTTLAATRRHTACTQTTTTPILIAFWTPPR
mmetsp:Transcript_16057/g.45429  ORF Transcript_16057/g.45429 Transcript_16057/m.45429 type:complete len:269 (+) Transcript_16057:1446-2252(+)